MTEFGPSVLSFGSQMPPQADREFIARKFGGVIPVGVERAVFDYEQAWEWANESQSGEALEWARRLRRVLGESMGRALES